MAPLETAFQPFWDLINLFRAVFLLIFIGFGVSSAFLWANLVKSLVTAGFLFFIAASLSSFMPEATQQVLPFIFAWGIGLAVGSIIKSIPQKIL